MHHIDATGRLRLGQKIKIVTRNEIGKAGCEKSRMVDRGTTEGMNAPRIELLNEEDRLALVRMLEDASDLDLRTIDQYRIRRVPTDVTHVAWVNGAVVGMLNGSYVADFSGMRSFESFELPLPPHAFLDRIHVHPIWRRAEVGGALLGAFVRKAKGHSCTFAGGHIDATSDPTVRIEFFETLGFEVCGDRAALTAGLFL